MVDTRKEVVVSTPTRGSLLRLGDLREMLEAEAIAELDDDWHVVLNDGNEGYSIRAIEPNKLTSVQKIAAVTDLVGGVQEHESDPSTWTLTTNINEMGLVVRTFNVLSRERIDTIEKLIQQSPYSLLDLRNFGQKSVDEVIEKLALAGFSLRPNDVGERHDNSN
jgi:hypothetical protein